MLLKVKLIKPAALSPAAYEKEQKEIVEQFEKDVKENPKILHTDENKPDDDIPMDLNVESSDEDGDVDIAALLKKVERDYKD